MLGVVLPRVIASEEVEEGVSAKIFNNGVEAKTRCRFYKTFFSASIKRWQSKLCRSSVASLLSSLAFLG